MHAKGLVAHFEYRVCNRIMNARKHYSVVLKVNWYICGKTTIEFVAELQFYWRHNYSYIYKERKIQFNLLQNHCYICYETSGTFVTRQFYFWRKKLLFISKCIEAKQPNVNMMEVAM